MAFRSVDPDPSYGERTFLKIKEIFPSVGARFTGIYQKDEPNTRLEKNPQDYSFKLKDGAIGVLTVNGELKDQLKRAKLQTGEKVEILFSGEKAIPNMSPRRLFKVRVTEATAPVVKPPPIPQKDEWAAEDDISF